MIKHLVGDTVSFKYGANWYGGVVMEADCSVGEFNFCTIKAAGKKWTMYDNGVVSPSGITSGSISTGGIYELKGM